MTDFSNANECLYGLVVDQREVDWRAKPPTLTGTFDGTRWRACFLFDEAWYAFPVEKYRIPTDICQEIARYLQQETPPKKTRVKKQKTRISQTAFIGAGLGVALIFASYAVWRRKQKSND